MAAAQANRDVCYFTYYDHQLRKDLYNMHKYLKVKGLCVCKWSNIGFVICSWWLCKSMDTGNT